MQSCRSHTQLVGACVTTIYKFVTLFFSLSFCSSKNNSKTNKYKSSPFHAFPLYSTLDPSSSSSFSYSRSLITSCSICYYFGNNLMLRTYLKPKRKGRNSISEINVQINVFIRKTVVMDKRWASHFPYYLIGKKSVACF